MGNKARLVVALAAASASIVAIAACVGDEPASGTPPGTDSGSGTDGTSSTDGSNPGNDSGGGGDASIDAAEDAPVDAGPACDNTKAFTMPPSRLDEVLPANLADVDDSARISPNGLELYLSRQPGGAGPRSIVRYVRTTKASVWTLDNTIPILSTLDGGAATTATGFTMMPDGLSAFYSYYYSGGNHATWSTKRSSVLSSAWSAPQKIPGFASDEMNTDFVPFLTADGNRVYFQSARSTGAHAHQFDVIDGGVSNLARVAITLADGGAAPDNEFGPVVTGDLLTIYFGYYTNAVPGGGLQRYIFKATRATTAANFGSAELVPELYVNGVFHQPTWISPDGCEMLFVSQRSGGTRIWRAVKPK